MSATLEMLPQDLEAVKALYAACHPTWPQRPDEWFVLVNSMVLRERRQIVAWTAMTLSPMPTLDLANRLGPNAICAWLVDTCVREDARGRGLAGVCMDIRLRMAEAAGCCIAVGACSNLNVPMLRLLETRGFKYACDTPNAFPDGSAGLTFTKQLGV